jgi:hypothetical protein
MLTVQIIFGSHKNFVQIERAGCAIVHIIRDKPLKTENLQDTTYNEQPKTERPEGKFLAKDQPHIKLITFAHLIRRELFSTNLKLSPN